MSSETVKDLRERMVSIENSYRISEGTYKQLEKAAQYELGQNKEYMDKAQDNLLVEARAQAFVTVAEYIEVLKAGGVVSGARVYNQLSKLRLLNPGMSIEENKVHFMKVFDHVAGEEKAVTALRAEGERILDLTAPFLAKTAEVATYQLQARLKVYKDAIAKGAIRPIKAKTGGGKK